MLLLALSACKSPVITTIAGVDTSLSVVVANPTTCAFCDAFEDVDTLRLDVSIDGTVVASDSFSYPNETVTLPALADFGVVRVTLVGMSGGRVISAGRTAEVVLLPDQEQSVPLVFLPINRGIPLDAPMAFQRSRHLALPRRDGSVLLIGGLDVRRDRATPAVEAYDPTTFTFTELDALPVAGLAEPKVAQLDNGTELLIGGFAIVDDAETPVPDSVYFDQSAFTEAGPLSAPRSGHCVAMFKDRQGIVLGGADAAADYLKPDEGTGVWGFSELPMRDFEPADVTNCVALPDGRVFTQGRDAASTGIWDVVTADDDPAEAFTAIPAAAADDARFVSGASLMVSSEGSVWVVGGADVDTGDVYADALRFEPDSMRFSPASGPEEPRFDGQAAPWILDGWYALGCGWSDTARTAGASTFELYSPETGEVGFTMNLDRDRPGCAMSVLPDGSLLVTGGYDMGEASPIDAALIVPWMEYTSAD